MWSLVVCQNRGSAADLIEAAYDELFGQKAPDALSKFSRMVNERVEESTRKRFKEEHEAVRNREAELQNWATELQELEDELGVKQEELEKEKEDFYGDHEYVRVKGEWVDEAYENLDEDRKTAEEELDNRKKEFEMRSAETRRELDAREKRVKEQEETLNDEYQKRRQDLFIEIDKREKSIKQREIQLQEEIDKLAKQREIFEQTQREQMERERQFQDYLPNQFYVKGKKGKPPMPPIATIEVTRPSPNGDKPQTHTVSKYEEDGREFWYNERFGGHRFYVDKKLPAWLQEAVDRASAAPEAPLPTTRLKSGNVGFHPAPPKPKPAPPPAPVKAAEPTPADISAWQPVPAPVITGPKVLKSVMDTRYGDRFDQLQDGDQIYWVNLAKPGIHLENLPKWVDAKILL